MIHPAPAIAPRNLVAGQWLPIPGDTIVARNPARPAEVLWSGTPDPAHLDLAVAAARSAAPRWAALPFERRAACLRRFADLARAREADIAALIRDEVGKPAWDARQEAALLPAKVDITLDAAPAGGLARVTPFDLPISPSRTGRCLFRPHGVFAVLGPFNFPFHLATGHIVPALLLGNTVVFKPSDKAPASGTLLAELLHLAIAAEAPEAPPGVINLLHGSAPIAAALAAHPDLDAIAFTGSWPAGRAIMQANLERPGRLLALEMGGSSAAVVLPDADLHTAALEIVRCAYVSAGQRCTCTRRAIVHHSIAPRFIAALAKATSTLIVGDPRGPSPVFMGPLISAPARDAILSAQSALTADGADLLVPSIPRDIPSCPGGFFLSPGLARVTRFNPIAPAQPEPELFGPLLRVSTARTLDDAIDQANSTRFGLAASLFTRDPAAIDAFTARVRAGCININTGTAGASSKLPFGGLGLSGNHRPAGAFALDYCAHPVALMRELATTPPTPPEGLLIDPDWLTA